MQKPIQENLEEVNRTSETETRPPPSTFTTQLKASSNDEDFDLKVGVQLILSNKPLQAEKYLKKIESDHRDFADACQLLAYLYKSQEGANPEDYRNYQHIKALAYFLASKKDQDRPFPKSIQDSLSPLQAAASGVLYRLSGARLSFDYKEDILAYKVIRCQFELRLITAKEYKAYLDNYLNSVTSKDNAYIKFKNKITSIEAYIKFKNKILYQLARVSLVLAEEQKKPKYIKAAKKYAHAIKMDLLPEPRMSKVAYLRNELEKGYERKVTGYLATVEEIAKGTMEKFGKVGWLLGMVGGNILDSLTLGLSKLVFVFMAAGLELWAEIVKNGFWMALLNTGLGWVASNGLEFIGKIIGAVVGAFVATVAFPIQAPCEYCYYRFTETVPEPERIQNFATSCLAHTDNNLKSIKSKKSGLFNLSTYSQLPLRGTADDKEEQQVIENPNLTHTNPVGVGVTENRKEQQQEVLLTPRYN
jgi:hypothetical protein